MEDAHRRKKQPEFVRKTILEQAARIASSGGLSQHTIAGVAKASGVTKGGLFYHFPNKSLLIESMLDYLLAELDNQIDAYMADDPMPYGRFTRAYVKTVFDDTKKTDDPCNSLFISMLSDSSIQKKWLIWMEIRLARHRDTDGSADLEIVRLAADGLWLTMTTQMATVLMSDNESLFCKLISMTKK